VLPGRLHGVIVIIPRPVKAHAHPGGGLVRLTRHLPRLDACHVNYRPLA